MEDQVKRIVAARLSGMTLKKIGRLEKLADYKVLDALLSAGVPVDVWKWCRGMNAADAERAAKLYNSGLGTPAIAKQLGVGSMTVLRLLVVARCVIKPRKTYTCRDDAFSSLNSPEAAYFAGLIAADGSVTTKQIYSLCINLHHADAYILEELRVWLGSTTTVKIRKRTSRGSDYAQLWLSSKQILTDLRRHGIDEHKSTNLRLPSEIDDYHFLHYARGFIDGDGYVASEHSAHRISVCGAYEFLTAFKSRLQKVTGVTSGGIHRLPSTTRIFQMTWGALADVKTICAALYDNNGPALHRKKERALAMLTREPKKEKQLKTALSNCNLRN